MLKMLILGVLLLIAYKLFFPNRKSINPPYEDFGDNEEEVEYEELD